MKIDLQRVRFDGCRGWKKSKPFFANPRGVLVHRVKSAATHYTHRGSHDSVSYECGNGATCRGSAGWTDSPPAEAVVCARCEALAVAAGKGSSEDVVALATGERRHVHVGTTRAVRSVCGCEELKGEK